jgi:hypothetical protein
MRPHRGAIDVVHFPVDLARRIGLGLYYRQDTLPTPGFVPPLETVGHRGPGAIALRQIPPGSAGAQNPQEAIDNAPMVVRGMASFRFLGRKQRLPPLPLGVGQVSSVHSTQ